MKKSPLLLVGLAVLLLGGVAMWLIVRDPTPAPGGPGADQPAPPVEVAQERPPPPVEQADLDRAARLDEARGLYYTMKQAFDGGRPNERSQVRMETALRRLSPGPEPRWQTRCLNRTCQVGVEAAPFDWREVLRKDPGVRAISDRIGWDPDGKDPAVYVLLAIEGAEPGAPALERVEKALLDSPAVRSCLARATEQGTVEYELLIDTTGITYTRGGTADVETQNCVEEQLANYITSARTPPKVKSDSRKVVLRTR